MKPLNPYLYNALKKTFGNITIANEGEPFRDIVRPNWNTRSRYKQLSDPISSGEYYKCTCPHCNDTRQRLWINHCWGVRHPVTGDDRLHLAHCFNERCLDDWNNRLKLFELVFPFGLARRIPINLKPEPEGPPAPPPPIFLPENLVSLSDSSAAAARAYLFQRGFDPQEIADRWGVQYSSESNQPRPAFRDRIVIPVYDLRQSFGQKGPGTLKLAGWQARSLTPDAICKYLTAAGMKTSTVLYGLSQALESAGPIIICEGVTDVWRLGPGAVAIFGKSLSSQQALRIAQAFHNRPVVVMLDRDAAEDAVEARGLILMTRSHFNDTARVVLGRLPEGVKDIGECSREQACKLIDQALIPPIKGLKIHPVDRQLFMPRLIPPSDGPRFPERSRGKKAAKVQG